MPRLTKRIVDTAVKQDKDAYLWDDELTGFGVKITPAGKKVFLIQYRVGGAKGRTRRVTLGHLGPVTCDEARTRAKELLGMVKTGKDPAEERDRRKAEKTFGETITSFEKAHVDLKTKDRTAEEYKRALKLHVPEKLRRRPIGDIGRADMEQLHQDLSDTPTMANKVIAILSKLFSWAEKTGLRPAGENPCRYVERYDEVKRERFLAPDELGNLGKALAADERQYVVAAIRLLLFTGARVSEILTAEWSWVDLAKGTIRLPDSKTGRKTLHLNAPALEVLNGLAKVKDNPFIIVGDIEKAHLVNIQKPWRAIRKAAGLDDVRLHDLRHTFASVGVEGGASLVMVGTLLGHTQPQTTKRYAHLANDPQRVAADAIAKRIADRLSPKPTPASDPTDDNVYPLKRGPSA
ncbi:MAG TPA: site-specific integrase [Devosia sp.]|jgi:integrase|uniref:tyrosine-type recombinase/integrase n=1 Tax=Devosia sp. TaxID=1871048 RepID=UPI002DDD9FF6|nr:site-specific integrase [Devosia sp.]HEV2517902.1 site-specific integrase [Devosia sp.]